MRGKLIILLALVVTVGFFNFYNNYRNVYYTRKMADFEKSYNAEKNINTELVVEHGELRSGKHIASLVRVEMSQFIPGNEQGSVIYVHEPAKKSSSNGYCIIDLVASKAEAKTVNIILD